MNESEDDGSSLIKNGTKKIFKIPKHRKNYLLPFKNAREKREANRGDYKIDWRLIHERSKLLSHNKNKADAFFSHKIGQG